MTQLKTAVILAAGRGARIQDHIERMPKGFIALDGKPIIEESIDNLIKVGIKKIVIVTGYRDDYYEGLRERYPGIDTVHNEVYASSGSMYSLFLARELLTEDFLLLESDIFYELRALSSLQNTDRDDAVLISGKTDSGDEVYVIGEHERIRNITKDRTLAPNPAGELTGLSRISLPLYREMLRIAEKDFADTLHQEYDTSTLAKTAARRDVPYLLIEDLAWTEIDTIEHLERARKTVLPRVREHNRIFH